MSILNGIFSLGFMAGVQIGARIASYLVVFVLSIIFGCCGLFYTLLVVQDSRTEFKKEAQKSILDRTHIIESFKTIFKHKRRLQIIVLLSSFLALMLCLNTGDFDFLMTRLKFGWESSEFSDYLTVQRGVRLTSLLLLLPFLSGLLHMSDTWIIVCGLLLTCTAYTLLCFASISWMMFVSAILQMNSVTTVTIRAHLSKQVEKDQIGKVFAVVGIGQSLVSLVSHSLFGTIYHLTLSVFPTAYLICVILPLFAAFVSVLVIHKKIHLNGEEGQECESGSCDETKKLNTPIS